MALDEVLRDARAGVRGGWFPDAFKILDDAFGADEWQLERRGEAGHAVWRKLFAGLRFISGWESRCCAYARHEACAVVHVAPWAGGGYEHGPQLGSRCTGES